MPVRYLRPKIVREEYKKYCDGYFREERRSGRTTAIAFATIAEAMRNPGEAVTIRDHERSSSRCLARTISDIVTMLNLYALKVDQVKLTLTFYLDEP